MILLENHGNDLHSIRRAQRGNPLSSALSANHFISTNDRCSAIASPKRRIRMDFLHETETICTQYGGLTLSPPY